MEESSEGCPFFLNFQSPISRLRFCSLLKRKSETRGQATRRSEITYVRRCCTCSLASFPRSCRCLRERPSSEPAPLFLCPGLSDQRSSVHPQQARPRQLLMQVGTLLPEMERGLHVSSCLPFARVMPAPGPCSLAPGTHSRSKLQPLCLELAVPASCLGRPGSRVQVQCVLTCKFTRGIFNQSQ